MQMREEEQNKRVFVPIPKQMSRYQLYSVTRDTPTDRPTIQQTADMRGYGEVSTSKYTVVLTNSVHALQDQVVSEILHVAKEAEGDSL